MNGAEHIKSEDDNLRVEQLPTPSLSPEPDDLAFPLRRRDAPSKAPTLQVTIEETGVLEDAAGRSRSSSRHRSIVNEDAVLSDSSERARPPQIKRPGDGRRKSSVSEQDKILKLSPRQIHELTREPASIPVRTATPIPEDEVEDDADNETTDTRHRGGFSPLEDAIKLGTTHTNGERKGAPKTHSLKQGEDFVLKSPLDAKPGRPALSSRALSTPPIIRRKYSNQRQPGLANEGEGDKRSSRHIPPPLNLDKEIISNSSSLKPPATYDRGRDPSPMPAAIPLPPFSLPTFLSLELAADRPSPLYIYRPSTADFPYESSKIKYERLVNFLFLPPILEGVLGFGALACLDAWMHVLTILPLRFLIAIGILVKWWGSVVIKEIRDIWNYVYRGLGRVWRRTRKHAETSTPVPSTPAEEEPPSNLKRQLASAVSDPMVAMKENGHTIPSMPVPELKEKRARSSRYRHRRTKSTPSALYPSHKADILKGLLVIISCAILMQFDASRMYHSIRGQAAIKLYVIYNVLEVFDRLFSALGQDVMECLFSRETLDRNPDGRSKVMRPFYMFVLALGYNVVHATALFYQVVTLNVAVNSYSNALLTLLMSNQFVEIKGTVFKRFEKENLFQLTCSDIVERFQLWLMLLIIAMRNIVEVGGLSITSGDSLASLFTSAFGGGSANTTFTASSIIPHSFTILPKFIGQVLSPFLVVLGSEMLVDWLKHAYITKFNQTKPEVYSKFLDVLAKDYYTDAFTDPNLTRRLGLPVLPLACLFIRAAVQTYHMFIATHMPLPFPSTATSLEEAATTSPATTAALAHIDHVFRRALGRSSWGAGGDTIAHNWYNFRAWELDDVIAFLTMVVVFLGVFLLFLTIKLVLGMILLRLARNRYRGMKERERLNTETGGKYIGGWGVVDVDEDKRRWIYNDDPESLKRLKERDEKSKRKEAKEREDGTSYGHVSRYAMVAKRIW